jgi:5-methylcytosine-specific restriction endonuclease McrA
MTRNRRKTPTTRKDLSYKKKGVEKKKRKTVKPRVPRTRNSSTMTEAAFWQWIRAGLRSRSRFWKPILEAKKAAKRPYTGPSKRQKYEYKCSECGQYFPDKEVQVHHIAPAGSLNCAQDLPGFVERLFCEKEGLVVLCSKCHDKQHLKQAA